MNKSALATVAMVLVVVGGLNWGLVGLFEYNLVDELFGSNTGLTRTIYSAVGVAAAWQLLGAMSKKSA